jgi:hypothetical protein
VHLTDMEVAALIIPRLSCHELLQLQSAVCCLFHTADDGVTTQFFGSTSMARSMGHMQ